MYENGFHNFELVKVLKKGIIKEVEDAFYKKKVYIKQDILYPITKEERDLFRVEYQTSRVQKRVARS